MSTISSTNKEGYERQVMLGTTFGWIYIYTNLNYSWLFVSLKFKA